MFEREQQCARVLQSTSRAGPVNAITWKIFSPVSRDPGIAIPGFPKLRSLGRVHKTAEEWAEQNGEGKALKAVQI